MCLYPKLVPNPKYKPNKKNGGKPPKAADPRLLKVPVGCGKCEECRKQLANNWRIRLSEEIEKDKNAVYVTLTFNEEKLKFYREQTKDKDEYKHDNAAATLAVRQFLERWRRKNLKSVKHWLITELGHENTERIHLHGIIWTNKKELIEKKWNNGFVRLGTYVNQRTINYIIKYILKVDKDHKNYTGKILCSAGIGKSYIETKINEETGEIIKTGKGQKFNQFKGEETKEYYLTKNLNKLALPMYYRQKIYTENEREKLWLQKIEKQTRYILGTEYKVTNKKEEKIWLNALMTAQKDNEKHGYGKQNWNIEKYLDTWNKTKEKKSYNCSEKKERR